MRRRAGILLVGLAFLVGANWAEAQFKKPKLGEKKKEEPAAEKSTPAGGATSSATMKAVTWKDNGIACEVPDNWEESTLDRDFASFMLSGTSEGAGLTANISRMGKDFPAEQSLKAYRDSGKKEKDEGKLAEAGDFNIGGVQGVLQVEAAKEASDDIRRLTWIGYQKRDGWNMVTIHLSSHSGAFPKHEETFRKILGTFKIETK